jgi:hypothetical protein
LRGSHVTIINDAEREVPLFGEAAKVFNGREIDFWIDPEPRTNGEHWWLRVYCQDAEAIRVVCGGNPTPFYAFHLTLGYANERNIAHSNYILECCKRFQIISSEPRKPFNEHQLHDTTN